MLPCRCSSPRLREKYARVGKTGRLSITNSKRTAIHLEIQCHLGGHADEASDDGTITLGSFESSDWAGYVGHPAVNNHSTVRWALDLGPGGTVAPQITYHYFTRR